MRSRCLAPSIAFVVVLIVGCAEKPANVLPAADTISKMAVELDQPDPPIEKFEVPRNHWRSILQSLSPARVDSTPAKWEGLGVLEITTKQGTTVVVDLWSLDGDRPGAFAVRQKDGSRTYYRGGSTKALVDSIRRAHSEFRKSISGR